MRFVHLLATYEMHTHIFMQKDNPVLNTKVFVRNKKEKCISRELFTCVCAVVCEHV